MATGRSRVEFGHSGENVEPTVPCDMCVRRNGGTLLMKDFISFVRIAYPTEEMLNSVANQTGGEWAVHIDVEIEVADIHAESGVDIRYGEPDWLASSPSDEWLLVGGAKVKLVACLGETVRIITNTPNNIYIWICTYIYIILLCI